MEKKWTEIFRAQLKEKRKYCGMSQKELAEKSGVSRGVIGMFESGNAGIQFDKAIDIALVLKINLMEMG